jgi:Ni/Co efflux regulator RcnB
MGFNLALQPCVDFSPKLTVELLAAEHAVCGYVLRLEGVGRSVEDTIMRIQTSAALLSVALLTAFAGPSASAAAPDHPIATPAQYAPYPDRRDYQDRYYPGDRRDDYYRPYPPPRSSYDAPLWRPGDVLPPDLLDFVVDDWEPRGLERPPGGHFWVRVGPQFILVRERDRMIARVINFD